MKDLKIRLTSEEGQSLYLMSAVLKLPPSLGTHAFTPADQCMATQEITALYKELNSRSPMGSKPERYILFGPADNWVEMKDDKGKKEGYRCKDLSLPVDVRLSEDAISGAVWCCVMAIHPASESYRPISDQAGVFWPVAEKIRKVQAIKKMIGLDTASHRRFDDDPEEKEVEEKAEKEEEAVASKG